jgi:hypothetical protein
LNILRKFITSVSGDTTTSLADLVWAFGTIISNPNILSAVIKNLAANVSSELSVKDTTPEREVQDVTQSKALVLLD